MYFALLGEGKLQQLFFFLNASHLLALNAIKTSVHLTAARHLMKAVVMQVVWWSDIVILL